MTRQERLAGELEDFLADEFPAARGLSRDVDLFDTGVIDSIGVVELIVHLECRYAVTIPDEALLSEDFGTVAGMARVVASLLDERVTA